MSNKKKSFINLKIKMTRINKKIKIYKNYKKI